MANKNELPPKIGDRALEMVMRDALDLMEEMWLQSGFSMTDCGMEIIEIVPEQPAPTAACEERDEQDNKVVEFRPLRAAG
jgi:hypothetical protein